MAQHGTHWRLVARYGAWCHVGWGARKRAVMSHPDHFDPLELVTLNELARLTKRSRRSLYRDIAAGRLRVVHLGRLTCIPRVEAERYVYGSNGDEAQGEK